MLESLPMRRTFFALALTASLVSTVPPGVFAQLWSFLSSLGDGQQGKEGCDPRGVCEPSPESGTPPRPIGCGMDPNGLCTPTS